MNKLPNNIPIFPLSGALLLPQGNLPLNIFEPRYISMIDYAFANNKIVGMIQKKSEDNNKLYDIGCIGKLTSYSETNDNRYLINLNGIRHFKILKEIKNDFQFRTFKVDYDTSYSNYNSFDKQNFDKQNFINKINHYLRKSGLNADLEMLNKADEKSLIIMTAMICPFSINEKQALVECKNIDLLAKTVISLFEFSVNESSTHESIN